MGGAATAIVVGGLAGCAQLGSGPCDSGEYPVMGIGEGTSSWCVPDDEEPGEGVTRYPEGMVPQRTNDKWDDYWVDHMITEDGVIVRVDSEEGEILRFGPDGKPLVGE